MPEERKSKPLAAKRASFAAMRQLERDGYQIEYSQKHKLRAAIQMVVNGFLVRYP